MDIEGCDIEGSVETLQMEIQYHKPQIDLGKLKIQKLKHGGIAITTSSPLLHQCLLEPWPTNAFKGANVCAHLPSYSENYNKVIVKNANQCDNEIEEMVEHLLLSHKEFSSKRWSIVILRRFNKKKTSQKIPVVLVELFSEEDAQLLCHMKEYKGLKFEKLV